MLGASGRRYRCVQLNVLATLSPEAKVLDYLGAATKISLSRQISSRRDTGELESQPGAALLREPSTVDDLLVGGDDVVNGGANRFERRPDECLCDLHHFEETVSFFDKTEKSPVGACGIPRIADPPCSTGNMLEQERFV